MVVDMLCRRHDSVSGLHAVQLLNVLSIKAILEPRYVLVATLYSL